jgi:tetratricopeptide (TPR) repeat protein
MPARKFGGSVAREYKAIYGLLLSGDARRIRQIRKVIAEHRLVLNALDVTDRVKRWINQDTDDPDAKSITFLKEIWELAKASGDDLDQEVRWKYHGRTARAMFYAGRFNKARKRFKKATRKVPKRDLPEFYDIHAAFAELEVYAGFPEAAIARIDKQIPIGRRLSWHNWVKAFAMHQEAFRKIRKFGRTAAPGAREDRNDYYQSNNLLVANLPGLSAQEKRDCHLLIAANYGAMFRLSGERRDQQRAEEAMEQFRSARSPSSNVSWSFRKELRGRFPTKPLSGDLAKHSREAVEDWREAYLDHYRVNLRHAGLDDTAGDDGDIDTVEEHPDDSGD